MMLTGQCQWFLVCEDESIGTVNHPTLGDVEICDRHAEWLFKDGENVPPTKMVPPLAAKHGRKMREILARAEEGE